MIIISEIELEHVLPQDPKEWSSYQVGDNDDQTIENLWEDGAIQANYSSDGYCLHVNHNDQYFNFKNYN